MCQSSSHDQMQLKGIVGSVEGGEDCEIGTSDGGEWDCYRMERHYEPEAEPGRFSAIEYDTKRTRQKLSPAQAEF